jgi:hypothetical protein
MLPEENDKYCRRLEKATLARGKEKVFGGGTRLMR